MRQETRQRNEACSHPDYVVHPGVCVNCGKESIDLIFDSIFHPLITGIFGDVDPDMFYGVAYLPINARKLSGV